MASSPASAASAPPVAARYPDASPAPARRKPRVVSRRRVAFGSVYWLGWIVSSPRSVVSSGVLRELDSIGVGAMRLVGGAAILVGVIAVFQIAYQLKIYSAESMTPRVLGWFAWREIGPLAVALLVVTRSASRIAGELAAMTVSTEIDALRVMGLDPLKYLVAPRLGALVVALPALTILADGLILVGGWIASAFFLRYNTLFYVEQLRSAFVLRDLVLGLVKALLFGFVIAIVAADEGLNVGHGVGLIGEATTRAVVFCLLGVLAADSFVNAVFYFIPGLAL